MGKDEYFYRFTRDNYKEFILNRISSKISNKGNLLYQVDINKTLSVFTNVILALMGNVRFFATDQPAFTVTMKQEDEGHLISTFKEMMKEHKIALYDIYVDDRYGIFVRFVKI